MGAKKQAYGAVQKEIVQLMEKQPPHRKVTTVGIATALKRDPKSVYASLSGMRQAGKVKGKEGLWWREARPETVKTETPTPLVNVISILSGTAQHLSTLEVAEEARLTYEQAYKVLNKLKTKGEIAADTDKKWYKVTAKEGMPSIDADLPFAEFALSVAQYMNEFCKKNKSGYGAKAEIARITGKDATYISKLLEITDGCPADILENWRTSIKPASINKMLEIAKLKGDPETQREEYNKIESEPSGSGPFGHVFSNSKYGAGSEVKDQLQKERAIKRLAQDQLEKELASVTVKNRAEQIDAEKIMTLALGHIEAIHRALEESLPDISLISGEEFKEFGNHPSAPFIFAVWQLTFRTACEIKKLRSVLRK